MKAWSGAAVVVDFAVRVAAGLVAAGAVSCGRLQLAPPEDVVIIGDVAYVTGDEADAEAHRLDLYLPRDAVDVPVVMFIHGGGWTAGGRSEHAFVGWALADEGIATAVIGYRLSPGVRHPVHVQDAARAFAWLHQNMAAYGGRNDRIFVMGHSAGGHLAALLALDGRYLAAHGLSTDAIRGVLGLSGIYRIPAMKGLMPLSHIFGEDQAAQADASPLNHVHAGTPPFRLFCANGDLPGLAQQARELNRALAQAGNYSELIEVGPRGHFSLLLGLLNREDALRQAIVDFVRNQSRPAADGP